ncbi:MAG: Nif3-like dinuclear metal center hexameric protein [Candidatus Thorarchaeota archaeon]
MATMWEVITNLSKLAPAVYSPKDDVAGVILGISNAAKQKRVRLNTAAVCIDVTVPIVFKCGELGANLLIAHRSPFPKHPSRFTGVSQLLLQQLLKRNITLYIAHYNWAIVDGGMTDVLVHTLGLKVTDVFNTPINDKEFPLGRGCTVPKETSLNAFIQYVAKRLSIPSINYAGNLKEEVNRLVIVPGDGINSAWLHMAWEQGYDTYLTGHLSHGLANQANQLKIKLIAVPQVASEIPGMSRLTQILGVEHPKVTFNFIEPSLSYSSLLIQP